MSPKTTPASLGAIVEKHEDKSRGTIIAGTESQKETTSSRRQESLPDSNIMSARNVSDRQRDKSRRSRRGATSSNASRNGTSRVKTRPSSSKHYTMPSRDESAGAGRRRHQHIISLRSRESSSSSSGEEDDANDNRAVAIAREHLTSPSLVSTLTSLTTATNNSGGSSGSNSTVTQASTSRVLVPKPPEPKPEAPLSPAVPDPPDVFSFLEKDSTDEEENDDSEDEDPTPEAKPEPEWLSESISDSPTLSPHQPSPPTLENMSSSGSSSFHSDEGSERIADNETDRSTSPERSVKGEEDTAPLDVAAPTDPTASKLASQMLAAQQRQSLHGTFQSFGTPHTSRGNVALPHAPSKALSAKPSQRKKKHGTRAEMTPITGYEALASKISSHGSKAPSITPMYRKFEHLNHRILLHLQDELAELEEQLHRIDNADTQSRSLFGTKATDVRIMPASRRSAAHAGGELEWHRIDLINKIAYKLNQYNQTLTSFNKLAKELDPPDLDAIKKYRHYLHTEKPVMENETRFLDAISDLVALDQCSATSPVTPPPAVLHHNPKSRSATPPVDFRMVVGAVAAAVLIPILTFTVIPGFLGRMTVVALVASGILSVLLQSLGGVAGQDLQLLGKEGVSCAIIYGVVMVVVAGIFA